MYIIGLTGNIATGKSTVCNILEQLGARVIDADNVSHAVLKRGSAAWRGVVDAFGYDILQYDGSVDRRKLGAVVFGDASKLKTLERITHPAVGSELALMVRDALNAPGSDQEVLVVEAVKLFEAGMHEFMDALWVVTAPLEEQKRRLMQDRGMSETDADARLAAQPPLDEKIKRANVVIDNGGSIEETRVQVLRGFVAIDPTQARDKTALLMRWLRLATPSTEAVPTGNGSPLRNEISVSDVPPTMSPAPAAGKEWTVRRAKPSDARMLAQLLAQIEQRTESLSRAEMLERQGKYGFWFVRAGEDTIALAAWQAENLAAVVRELWVANMDDAARAFPLLLQAIEAEANALTCEVVVILVPERASGLAEIAANSAGYETTTLDDLHKLWRSVVEPLLMGDEILYSKRLRDIVTKPI